MKEFNSKMGAGRLELFDMFKFYIQTMWEIQKLFALIDIEKYAITLDNGQKFHYNAHN